MPKMTLNIRELDAFERSIALLREEAKQVAKRALYDGAAVAADALRISVDALDRVSDVQAIQAWRTGKPTILSVSQKNGLREGLGVSPMKERGGTISVKIGFDGYNRVKTKRWPNGQPNQVIAASCEHGSSAMLEQPFIRPTMEKNRSAILRAMIKTATGEITKIFES